MKRVASLFLPALSIERLRRSGLAPPPEPRQHRDSPGGLPSESMRPEDCSCPRGGGWRPGARWANREARQIPGESRAAGASSSSADGEPLVTAHRVGSRMVIAAVSSEAAALGLAPGMAVTHARMLVPNLELRDADPQADAALLTRLALFAARRWTPHASISAPDGLWLDLSGVAHLFGGERAMCARILRFCARAGFTARIAVAGTTGAAHALAHYSPQPITLCANGDESEAIAHLPPAALRLDQIALGVARRFGIASIAVLLAMPRGPLGRRFGAAVLTRIDQAIGRVSEPLDPIVPHDPPRATLRLLEPIGTAEAIGQVIGDLAGILAQQLETLGFGARRVTLICERVDNEDQKLMIGMAGATRDPEHLAELLRMRVETIDPGFGIEAMHLVATRFEPLAPKQIGSEDDADLPPLVDRIAGRIGADRVFRCSAIESDVPERSVCRIGALETPLPWPSEWPRPVRLLARPEPLDKVIAELPDQPPLRFAWRGKTYRVRKADGPERIFGEWWRRTAESAAVRDYFQVEDEGGARFWLFRRGDGLDPGTGDLSWWMHGLFG